MKKVIEYRGFEITRVEGVQVGYDTPSGKRGKGRKVVVWYATREPDDYECNADSLEQAKQRVDDYWGTDPT